MAWLTLRRSPLRQWALSRDYMPVRDESGDSDEFAKSCQTSSSRKRWPVEPVFGCNASAMLVLISTAALLIISSIQCTVWYMRQGVAGCRPESFTPLHRLADIQYKTANIRSGHLADSSAPDSIFRMAQSLEVHDAWAEISKPGTFPITRDDVIRLGKDPDIAIKAPESFGWPKDSYIASAEFTHQLHCLNTLRKNLLHNYHWYWGSRFGFSPNIVWEWHVTHCLDILRQHLMCNADTTVYTYYFPEGQQGIFGDFSVRKKCVDFERLQDWNKQMREENAAQNVSSAWRDLVEHVIEGPAIPGLPLATNETRYVDVGDDLQVPVGTIAGLEGREYCLGDLDGGVA